MALCNSMCTKTWSFEKTTFPLNLGQNGRGAKAHSRSQWRDEPRTKAMWKVESRKDIVHGLFDFSKVIFFFILYCAVSTCANFASCTRAHMHA